MWQWPWVSYTIILLVFFRGSPGFGDLLSIISLCPSIRLRRCGTVFSQKLGSSTGRSAGSWVKRGGTHKRNFLSVMATSSADGWFAYRFYPCFVALWALSKSSSFHFARMDISGPWNPQEQINPPAGHVIDVIDQEKKLFHRVHCYNVFMGLGWFRDRKVVGPLRPEEASGSFLGLETLETHHDGGFAGTLFACLKGEKNISHAWFWRYPPAIKHCEKHYLLLWLLWPPGRLTENYPAKGAVRIQRSPVVTMGFNHVQY